MEETKTNIRTSTDAERITTVWLDVQGKSVNTFTAAVLAELGETVARLEQDKPAGVISASGKPGCFVAGRQ